MHSLSIVILGGLFISSINLYIAVFTIATLEKLIVVMFDFIQPYSPSIKLSSRLYGGKNINYNLYFTFIKNSCISLA